MPTSSIPPETNFSDSDLKDIRKQAIRLGFSDVKFMEAKNPDKDFQEDYREYLSKQFQASMKYLENVRAKFSVQKIYEKSQTIAVFSLPYMTSGFLEESKKHRYCISAYAAGRDYHIVVKEKLQGILEKFAPGRIVCDTTPFPERFYGQRCGLGFIGKNAMLIHPENGSYFFLAFILFEKKLPIGSVDSNISGAGKSRKENIQAFCGDCRRCIDACPGGALDGSGLLDARKCYSFWSIENRSETIAHRFKKMNSLLGCDICQQVCPYNSRPLLTNIADFEMTPITRLVMDGNTDLVSCKGTPFQRAGKKGLMRNKEYIDQQNNLPQKL